MNEKDNENKENENTENENTENETNSESNVENLEKEVNEGSDSTGEVQHLFAPNRDIDGILTGNNAATVKGSGKPWMYISLGLAILLAITLVKPPFGGASSKNDAVATVNGVIISKDKLFDSMAELGGTQTLDNLIQDELIKQEADKAGIKVTDADVDKEIESIKGRFPTEEDFNSALQQANMTLDDLKKQTPLQLQIRKILEPTVTVTDADVKDYFDKNKASLSTPMEVRASHILVATEKEADDILAELKNGGDFATIAKAKSTDTGSKEQGGDLGFFGTGTMDPAFEKAAFSLKKDEISAPIKTTYGYHIIKLTDRKEAKEATFDEEKTKIKDQLISQKVSELSSKWLADIKSKAKITNSLADKAETPASGTTTQ